MTDVPPELTAGPSRAKLVEFMRRDYATVVASVTLVAGDRDSAEDAVQDAVAALWQRSDGFRPDNLAAWVTVAAANRCRTAHRRRGAESRALERLGPPPAATADPAAAIGDASTLAAALQRLPERQRHIAVLHYVGDHSVATIAGVLGVHEGTVKTQLSRARAALAAALSEADER